VGTGTAHVGPLSPINCRYEIKKDAGRRAAQAALRGVEAARQRLGIGIVAAFAAPRPPGGKLTPCAASR
jgi:hypothetical protein